MTQGMTRKIDATYQMIAQGKRIKPFIVICLVCGIFCFLFSSIYDNWHEVSSQIRQIDPVSLFWALIVLMIRHVLMAYIWQKTLSNFFVDIPFTQAFRIWYLAVGGRYLPGRIWHVMGMFYLSNEAGIPKKAVLLSGVYNMALSLLSAFIVGLALIDSYVRWETSWYDKTFLCLFALMLLYIFPFVLKSFVSVLMKVKKTYKDDSWDYEISTTAFKDWLFPFILYILSWILYGVALFFILRSIIHFPLAQLVHVCSSYAVSHVAGFISLFTPAGLGVREGTLSLALSKFIPVYLASVAAVLCRLMFTLGEFLSFLISLGIKKSRIL